MALYKCFDWSIEFRYFPTFGQFSDISLSAVKLIDISKFSRQVDTMSRLNLFRNYAQNQHNEDINKKLSYRLETGRQQCISL